MNKSGSTLFRTWKLSTLFAAFTAIAVVCALLMSWSGRTGGLAAFKLARERLLEADTARLRLYGYPQTKQDVWIEVSIAGLQKEMCSAVSVVKGPWGSNGLAPDCFSQMQVELRSKGGWQQRFDLLNGEVMRVWVGENEYTAQLASNKLEAILIEKITQSPEEVVEE